MFPTSLTLRHLRITYRNAIQHQLQSQSLTGASLNVDYVLCFYSSFAGHVQINKTNMNLVPTPTFRRRHARPILLRFVQCGGSVGIATSCNRSSPRQTKFKIIALCSSIPKSFGVIILQSPDTQAWQNDYLQGTGCEMYTETLSPSFTGMTFPQASE